MGSTFATHKKKGRLGGMFKNMVPDKYFLQFVPGNVLEVIINTESAGYNSPRDINAILQNLILLVEKVLIINQYRIKNISLCLEV